MVFHETTIERIREETFLPDNSVANCQSYLELRYSLRCIPEGDTAENGFTYLTLALLGADVHITEDRNHPRLAEVSELISWHRKETLCCTADRPDGWNHSTTHNHCDKTIELQITRHRGGKIEHHPVSRKQWAYETYEEIERIYSRCDRIGLRVGSLKVHTPSKV